MLRRAAALFAVALLSSTISAHVAFASTYAAPTSPIGAIEEFAAGLVKSTEAIIASIESAVGNIAASINPSGDSASYTASAAAPEAAPQVYPSMAPAPLPTPAAVVAASPIPATPKPSSDNIFKLQSAIAELTEGVQGLTALYEAQTPSSKIESQIASLQSALTFQNSQNNAAAVYPLGDGTGIAAASNINNLSGVTITNANLSASEIPALDYLSLSGGTLTGALTDSSTAPSSFVGALGIGTTSPSDLFALNGAAYLADISVPPSTTNRLYANSGNLYWAGNLLGGASTGNWTSDGTNVWRAGGAVGIGTTTPASILSLQQSGGATITLSNGNGGSGLSQITANNSLTFNNSGGNSYLFNQAGSTVFEIGLSGLVGIGTTSPSSKLSVAGSGYFTVGLGVGIVNSVAGSLQTTGSATFGGNVTTGSLLTAGSSLYPVFENAFSTSAATTLNSAVITVSSATGIQVGMDIAGDTVTFPQPIWVVAISGNTVTMSAPAGATNASIAIQFGNNRWSTTSSMLTNTLGVQNGYFGESAVGNSTWANESFSGIDFPSRSSVAAINPNGAVSIFGAIRSSDAPSARTTAALELLGRNDSTSSYNTWTSYLQTEIPSTAVPNETFGVENDIYNQQPAITVDPFAINRVGATYNERLGCAKSSTGILGGTNCSVALDIVPNGALFGTGINFGLNALATSTLANPPAIALPAGANGDAIDWYTAANTIGWSLFSNDTSSNLKQIELENSALAILNSNVGIGTTTPYSRLSVWGPDTSAGTDVFSVVNNASSTLLSVTDSGGVGIGTTSPYTLLGLAGSKPQIALNDTTNSRLATIGESDGFNLFVNQQGSGNITLQSAGFTRLLLGGSGQRDSFGSLDYVGIGTTTPYSRLEVWGFDTASTSAFAVVNSASTTEFTVYDTGNAVLAGSLTQNSDIRLKTNISDLDGSSSLSEINRLNPVTFNWIDPNKSSVPQFGFIAQQVQSIFPNLVSTTSPTALTPDGTLSLNYIDLLSPIVSAIQELDKQITSLASTIADFAQSFTTEELTFNRATGQQLCLQEFDGATVCVNGDQLAAVLASASQSASVPASPSAPPSSSTATDTPPVIQINGDNPAIIQIGASYADLGATITGPQADLNLGVQTYLNGTLESPIELDTSAAATDTIAYVVTDSQGLTSTSTRTVIVEPAPDPSISQTPPSSAAASTTATTTVQ